MSSKRHCDLCGTVIDSEVRVEVGANRYPEWKTVVLMDVCWTCVRNSKALTRILEPDHPTRWASDTRQ